MADHLVLGIPGPVRADGTVLKCANLGWDITPAAKIMQEMTGIPVKAGNDANVAALGEMWKGGDLAARTVAARNHPAVKYHTAAHTRAKRHHDHIRRQRLTRRSL